ncbi:MAG: hypothetical protein ABSA39_15015 [Edaphobacter sp.]
MNLSSHPPSSWSTLAHPKDSVISTGAAESPRISRLPLPVLFDPTKNQQTRTNHYPTTA